MNRRFFAGMTSQQIVRCKTLIAELRAIRASAQCPSTFEPRLSAPRSALNPAFLLGDDGWD